MAPIAEGIVSEFTAYELSGMANDDKARFVFVRGPEANNWSNIILPN